MKLKDLFPTSEQLKFVQGIEKNLLDRKRKGVILSGIVSVAGGLLQVLISTTGKRDPSEIVIGLAGFAKCVYYIFAGQWDKLGGYQPDYELAGIFILGIGLLIYFLVKRTRLLLKESEEPFRYTFWVEPFERVRKEDKPFEIESGDAFHEGDERLKRLLHHDLMERLNGRIRRLSLLDGSKLGSSPAGKDAEISDKDILNSHIHISGYYTLRREGDGEKEVVIIQVMPQIRIGPPGTPATLASPIKYTLDKDKKENKFKLDPETNYKIVERVYSSIATEAYRRIQSDIKEKIKLFPTAYLRAVALFYEAEDFARSNTIDAYDQAIELYKESLRYFDLTEIKTISRALMKCPILWGMEVRFQHMKARVQIGHAKCLIYRRQISALSGRYRNPLFEIRKELKEVVYNLLLLHNRINSKWPVVILKEEEPDENEQQRIKRNNRLNTSLAFLTSPKDSWLRNLLWRANQLLFEIQNRLLFDAYLVSALTYYYLKASQKAKEFLGDAKAVNTQLSERNALYLLTAGVIEPDIEKALPLFRQATEVAPDFQIAQYFLAYNSEMRFRTQNEIEKGRAEGVIKEYDAVLKINPGNIAALAAQGYLYWLIKEREKAKQKLNAGRDLKAMVRQTFVGELNYGLARIAAEEGDFNTSYDCFTEAILADQGVGGYSVTTGKSIVTSYFDYIGSAILKRYESYKEAVENTIGEIKKAGWKDEKGNAFSETTIDVVHSFVLNDYGNSCLNYFHRFGDPKQLENAIEVYDQAGKITPQNLCAYYNLHNAYAWRNKEGDRDKSIECLKRENERGSPWSVAIIALARSLLRQERDEINKIIQEVIKKVRDAEEARLKLEVLKEGKYLRPRTSDRCISAVHHGMSRGMSPDTSWDTITTAPQVYPEASGLQDKIEKDLEDARNRYRGVEERSAECVKNVLPQMRWVIENTKLSTLYEGFEFDKDGKGINSLLSQKIAREKLDEYDVDALKVWAEVLSSNYTSQNREAQWAAERLCHHIQKEYYPDNYDVNLILQDMCQYMTNVNQIEMGFERKDRKKEMEDCIKNMKSYTGVIKQTVVNWLDQDPIHYASLAWASLFFKEEPELLSKFYNKAYGKATEVAVKGAVYYANLGEFYRALQKWGEARRTYEVAIRLEGKNAIFQNGLGNIYFESGVYDECIKCYRKATEIARGKGKSSQDVAVYYANLGGGYKELGKWEEAKAAYAKALELDSKPIYESSLGRIYGNLGEWDKTIEHCRRAVELRRKFLADPNGLEYYYESLAEAYFKAGKLKEFETLFEDSRDFGKEAEKKAFIYNRIGNLFFEAFQNREAVPYYEKAIGFDGQRPIYECNLGRTHGNLENWDEMIKHCQRAVELRRKTPTDPYGLDYYYGFLVEAYFKDGRLKEFEGLFEALGDLKNEPEKRAAIYNRIGNFFFGTSQNQEAIPYYEKAIDFDKARPIYECNLGLTYGNLGQWGKAIEHYTRAVELRRKTPSDPNGLDYYYDFLAEAYFKAGRLREFEAFFEESMDLKDDPGKKAVIYNRIGNLLAGASQNHEAIPYYETAIHLDSTRPIYECNLGLTYGNLGQWGKAIEHYTRAVELRRKAPTDPYGLDYYYGSFAEGYFNDGRLKEFEELFETSGDLKDEPEKKAVIYNRIGNLLADAKQGQEAIPYYEKAIDLDKTRPIYECNLGLTYSKLPMPNWDEMIKHCQRAVELRRKTPTDPDGGLDYYYEFLAEAYFKAGRLKEFEELFEASGDLKDEPEKKAVVNNRIGNLYFGELKKEESILYYKNAAGLAPHVAVYHANLGVAYKELRKWEAAIKQYTLAVEKATELNPNDKTYHKNLGLVYNERGVDYYRMREYDKAIEDYKKAIDLISEDPTIRHNLYLAYEAKGMYKEARESLQEAIRFELDPNQLRIYSDELTSLKAKG